MLAIIYIFTILNTQKLKKYLTILFFVVCFPAKLHHHNHDHKGSNNITDIIDYPEMFAQFPNLEHFDASNNHLHGPIDLSSINTNNSNFSLQLQYFDLTNNNYNSSKYLDGSDDYITFTLENNSIQSEQHQQQQLTIKIDNEMQCDPEIYCNYTSFVPTDRIHSTCTSITDCISKCGSCLDPCDNSTQTEPTLRACQLFKYLNGIYWYYWDEPDYCNPSSDVATDFFEQTLGCQSEVHEAHGIRRIDFSDLNLTGELNYVDSIHNKVATLILANNSISGEFKLDELLPITIDETHFSIGIIDISNNLFSGVINVDAIIYWQNFHRIDFSNNYFTNLSLDYYKSYPSAFSSVTQVDFSSNRLNQSMENINKIINYAQDIIKLDVSNNFLYGTLNISSERDSLEYLDISNNLISKITNYDSFTAATYINFSHNNIFTELNLTLFGDFETIDLSYNYYYKDNTTLNWVGHGNILYADLRHNLLTSDESIFNKTFYVDFRDSINNFFPSSLELLMDVSVRCQSCIDAGKIALDRNNEHCEGQDACVATCECLGSETTTTTIATTTKTASINTAATVTSSHYSTDYVLTTTTIAMTGTGDTGGINPNAVTIPESSFLNIGISNNNAIWIIVSTFIIFVLFALLSYLHKRYSISHQKPLIYLKPVDDSNSLILVGFALQSYDFISDCNFVVFLYKVWEANVKEYKYDERLLLYFVLSLMFVIIPWVVNLFWLFVMRYKSWQSNNWINRWLRHYAWFIVFLTMMSGDANVSIDFCNSRAFGLSLFDMGMTKRERIMIGKYRVIFVTLLENLPQICIQIIFSLESETIAGATIFALIL